MLKKGFLNKKINEIKINNNIDWRRNILDQFMLIIRKQNILITILDY